MIENRSDEGVVSAFMRDSLKSDKDVFDVKELIPENIYLGKKRVIIPDEDFDEIVSPIDIKKVEKEDARYSLIPRKIFMFKYTKDVDEVAKISDFFPYFIDLARKYDFKLRKLLIMNNYLYVKINKAIIFPEISLANICGFQLSPVDPDVVYKLRK